MGYQFRQPLRLDLPSSSKSRRGRRWFGAMLLFALVAGFVGVTTQPRYDGSKIAAGPFEWPAGCEARHYRAGDRLPKSCFSRFQEISHDWIIAHGLKPKSGGRGKTAYFRLGNDAVNPLCVVWEESCTITNIYPGLFVVDRKIAGATSAEWLTLQPGEAP